MKKSLLLVLFLIFFIQNSGCSSKSPEELVFVQGGNFVNSHSSFYGETTEIEDFYIGKQEVTQKEWSAVMGHNPSEFKGDNLPVETVSWYEAIEYCNKRSDKEGKKQYYNINKEQIDPNNTNEFDDVKWIVTINQDADGYRLPTEAEWEYAAGGGQQSKNYLYSGSGIAEEIGWYWRNSGKDLLSGDWSWPAISANNSSTKAVGSCKPNELGLYDMSGNVREWCFDWYGEGDANSSSSRVTKGGGWIGDVSCLEPSFRGKFEANGKGSDQGLRICRNAE